MVSPTARRFNTSFYTNAFTLRTALPAQSYRGFEGFGSSGFRWVPRFRRLWSSWFWWVLMGSDGSESFGDFGFRWGSEGSGTKSCRIITHIFHKMTNPLSTEVFKVLIWNMEWLTILLFFSSRDRASSGHLVPGSDPQTHKRDSISSNSAHLNHGADRHAQYMGDLLG